MGEAGILVLAAGHPFLKAIRTFNSVVDSCFGQVLDPSFPDNLDEFLAAYQDLPGASITVKIHVLANHTREFLARANSGGTNFACGYWSEQAFEAMHYHSKEAWDQVKVNKHHPLFGAKLLKFVISSNAKKI